MTDHEDRAKASAESICDNELNGKSDREVFDTLFPGGELKRQIRRDIQTAERIEREAGESLARHVGQSGLLVGERVQSGRIKNMRQAGQIAQEYFTGLKDRKIMTGIPFIDKRTRGVGAGETMLIIARTAVGKTILGQNILKNMSKKGAVTLFFSLEMTLPTVYERFSQMSQRMSSEDFEYLFQQDPSEAKLVVDTVAKDLACVYIIDQPLLSVTDIGDYITMAEELEIGTKVKAVLIDYMGLIDTHDQHGSAYERVSQVARELAGMAKQKQVAAIIIHQVSRAGGSGNQKVTFNMARDSGVIEEAVDYVVCCWRPKENPRQKIVMSLDKNRNGSCRQETLDFNPRTLEITEKKEESLKDKYGYKGELPF